MRPAETPKAFALHCSRARRARSLLLEGTASVPSFVDLTWTRWNASLRPPLPLYTRFSTSRFRDAQYRHLVEAKRRKTFRAILRAISRHQTLERSPAQSAARTNEWAAPDRRT